MKKLLLPLSFIYGLVVGIRNFMFKIGILSSRRFNIPIICIGNITVGGTGKTPHTELIIEALKENFRVACLSRGYKRKTSGFMIVTEQSTPSEVGDEPLQIKRKFPDIIMACDRKRVRGIEKLLAMPEPPQVIILDDAFQHRYVQADKNIVLIDYNRPVTEDFLLPAGRLREGTRALKRADYLIVTKCPKTIQPIQCRILSKHLAIKPYQKLFFTALSYGDIQPLFPNNAIHPIDEECHILCLTGIAQPQPYIEYLHTLTPHITTLQYPDHHTFSSRDIQHIIQNFNNINSERKYIFTTEKDAMRLSSNTWPEEMKPCIFYIPVKPLFLKEEEAFLNELKEYVRKNQR